MTDFVTREEREKLRRLWEQAATGEWELESCMKHNGYGWHVRTDEVGGLMLVDEDHGNSGAAAVAALNALPRLLDTIDALEAENARLRATMRHWEGEIGGATCDWGYCDRPTEDYRISPDTLTVLPVCAAHTAGAEAQRPVWDAIWRLTNLPFSDDDRRKIQLIALAFMGGGPRPGSWVAQYIAALTTAPARDALQEG